MDVHFVLAGQRFRWDAQKATSNLAKRGVRFEQACEVFFDPFSDLSMHRLKMMLATQL